MIGSIWDFEGIKNKVWRDGIAREKNGCTSGVYIWPTSSQI